MPYDAKTELYQQVIIEHNKNPRNFKKLEQATHQAEGYNPLCGDDLVIYLRLGENETIEEVTFEGQGCAISRASASMMTQSLKGKSVEEAQKLFEQFHSLITGKLDPDQQAHTLGKLAIFKTIWHFPARVKCASLAWHTFQGALDHTAKVTTE